MQYTQLIFLFWLVLDCNLSYGLFDMQVEPYHTFDSGDEENYYEEYLKDLEAGYIKMYRNGYRCPRDPWNADSSY